MKPIEGRKRVILEDLKPQVDGGRYPAKRILGDTVRVTAAILSDGHDHVAGRLLYRPAGDANWQSTPMLPIGNDVFSANFLVTQLGNWEFTVEGWVDHFDTWCSDLEKRIDAQPDPARPTPAASKQDIPLALRSGALLLDQAASRASGADKNNLDQIALTLRWMADQDAERYEYPLDDDIKLLVARYPDLTLAARFERTLPLWVDRERARFSAWYELFPRSTSPTPGQHGTLRDVEAHLPRVAAMGFDVLYLPPIHPIGKAFRKGPNNNVVAALGDHGSPWAIGSPEGGHKAVHPDLGTLTDLDHLVTAARTHGIDLALDIAFQCSPDHPWVVQHPDWFQIRPDGSIQYAEESAPKSIRTSIPLTLNPRTGAVCGKSCSPSSSSGSDTASPFSASTTRTPRTCTSGSGASPRSTKQSPEVLFLAEAFTRPHLMYALAKGGYTQSYTYFTWRTTKAEIQGYMEELIQPPISDFFRPNFWPNTPDILPPILQSGGRPAFMQRVILAATLAANYGLYGPAYELGENAPFKPGGEEYLNSEKYEIRQWELDAPHSIAPLVTKLNTIRRENHALQSNDSLRFPPRR